MIYFENASFGEEGFNTHVMSWTMAISLSNFLDRDFYFEYEIPCSTPPDYASEPEFNGKFEILLKSPRSLVSQLLTVPNRRIAKIDREVDGKLAYQLLYSHFATTVEMKRRFEGTIVWDSFGVGRIPLIKEEILQAKLIEWTHTKLSHPSVFYFLPRDEKRALLESVRLRYLDSIETLAARINEEVGEHNAVHIRMGDYFANYGSDGYRLNVERFGSYARSVFGETGLPILVATDGLQEKETLAKIFDGYKVRFIDEMIFDDYSSDYRQLEYTDFNVVTILNQLLCASATSFIGTYRSTFTSIIHRLRQERFAKSDFEFFPDDKVINQLDARGRISPDRSGFFDWNRYSVFAANHNEMAWMREWNHDLSAIEI